MKVLSLVSQKGGVGKTTLATALAVAGHQDGKRVVMMDLDPQASATFWMDTRKDDALAVTSVPASRLPMFWPRPSEAGADLAIVDTPPFAKDIAFEAAERADFVLIPTRPAVLDVMAMTRTIELIRNFPPASGRGADLLPAVRQGDRRYRGAVRALGAELCPVRIGSSHRLLARPAERPSRPGARSAGQGRKGNRRTIPVYTYNTYTRRPPMTEKPRNAMQAVLDRAAQAEHRRPRPPVPSGQPQATDADGTAIEPPPLSAPPGRTPG